MTNDFSSRMIWHAVGHCRRHAPLLTCQASFTEKLAFALDCDHSFFAVHGNDGHLDVAVLDVKHGIGGISLGEDRLILRIFGNGTAVAGFGDEVCRIKRSLVHVCQMVAPSPQRLRGRIPV
jgi:hypothetical protein